MSKFLLILLGLVMLGSCFAGVEAAPAYAAYQGRIIAATGYPAPTAHPTLPPHYPNRRFPISDSFLFPTPTPQAVNCPINSSLKAERVPVIEYHHTEFNLSSTVQMKTAWFLEQMDWLDQNCFRTLSGDELVRFANGIKKPALGSFILRFDLGLPQAPNFREAVIPALQKHGFSAIFFLMPSVVSDKCEGDYFCWSELRAWEKAGLIEVASHGINHPNYQEIKRKEQVWDAGESKRFIEDKLGYPVRFFAFPYDSVPENPAGLLKPLGYLLGFAGPRSERSLLFHDPDPYALPAYYPYSGEKLYPVINGSGGLTFGELMLKAIK